MAELRFLCTAIEKYMADAQSRGPMLVQWQVTLMVVSNGGDERHPSKYGHGAELVLKVFDERFAREFEVGEEYTADLAKAE